MKPPHVLILAGLLTATLLNGADYETLMKQADQEGTIANRYAIWDQAIALGDAKQKADACEQAFTTAKKTDDVTNVIKYGGMLSEAEGATPEVRASARYTWIKRLSAQKWEAAPKSPTLLWEEYLAMPGRDRKKDAAARLELVQASMDMYQTRKAFSELDKVIAAPETSDNERIDALLQLTQLQLQLNRQPEALETLKKLLTQPRLTPVRKANLHLKTGDTILLGTGYYPNLEDKDYEAAYREYEAAMSIRNLSKDLYFTALFKIIQSKYTRRKYNDVIDMCAKAIKDKKNAPNLGNWQELKKFAGRSKVATGDYEGAIADFEALRNLKYQTGDICRYLGEAYYLNRQYSLAIGCYAEALEALKGAEDDRPNWCKSWIGRLKWFANSNNTKRLEDMEKKHRRRLAASNSNAAGSNAVKLQKKKKPAIKKLEDIGKETGNLADEGLMLE